MRILYHHRTRFTDAQRVHTMEIVNALRDLGHEVEIVSLIRPETAGASAERDAGEAAWRRLARRIPFTYEMIQLGYNVVGIPMLLSRLLSRRPAFVYERYSLFNFSGVIAARLCRRPLILEVNAPFALEQRGEGDIRAYRLAAWTERVICNLASKVVVVSSPLQRILLSAGVRPERLVLMPNGVDVRRFAAEAPSGGLRDELRLGGKVVIGFVGWFRKWHGLDLLLKAFHDMGLGERGARLLLIGDGPAMPEMRAYAKEHLPEYVVFTGPLPHEEVPRYLSLIDVAVQPAANEYCCPMKILEYMGMGKPIIAPRQENIEELLTDGRDACLFTPGDTRSMGDAMLRMVSDPDAMRAMGRRARQTIDERGMLWAANAQRVVELATGSSERAAGQTSAER